MKIKNNILYNMNHKNLIREIEEYGSTVKIKQVALAYIGMIALCILSGYAFKIPLFGYLILIAISIWYTPQIMLLTYKNMYEQRRFSDANKYIEKMLYYFKNSKKMLVSLERVYDSFPDGMMRRCVGEAIEYINSATASQTIKKEALAIIEKNFPVSRIVRLHTFMLTLEEKGGNPEMGTEVLLSDRDLWTTRILEFQQEKAVKKNSLLIFLGATFVLCLIILYSPVIMSVMNPDINMDISSNPLCKISSLIFIIEMIIFYVKFNKQLSKDWFRDVNKKDSEKDSKKYEAFINYNSKKEQLKANIYGGVSAIGVLVIYVITANKILFITGLAVTVFLLLSNKLGYDSLKKYLTQRIKTEFPGWLINVSLLLQNNNVYQSISKTIDSVPEILKPAVRQLINDIDENPRSSAPYKEFLCEFKLDEINEAMMVIYSIKEAYGADAQAEIRNIININNKMLDKSEKKNNENKLFYLDARFDIPIFLAFINMLVYVIALFIQGTNIISSISII